MSPEQARDSGNVDARTDVWSLGTIVYELLAGKAAFDGDDVPATIMMIATEEPALLETLRPDVPVALAAVVRRCLRKNREERFADVAELARALEPFAPLEARGSVARIARILGHDSLPPAAIIDNPPSARTRRPRWLAVALAGAVSAALLGAFVSKGGDSFPVTGSVAERPPLAATAAPTATAPREVAPAATSTSVASPAATGAGDQAPDVERAAKSPARNRPPGVARRTPEPALSPDEPGLLTFEANVPAAVALDGRPLGTTPQSATAPPGSHTIVFAHPELGEKSHTVTLAPGQEKAIRATFEPRTAN
jgi:serine/threonine-protein kinase